MAVSQEYIDYICDQLVDFGPVDSKRMFGGVGFFRDGLMFAMIGGNVFRLKADAENEGDFIAHNMEPLRHAKKPGAMPYWEVPVSVLEDSAELAKWAQKSFEAAQRQKK